MGWASEEFETIDLGDKQLNKRAALLAEQLVDSPSASIPKASREADWRDQLHPCRARRCVKSRLVQWIPTADLCVRT